MKYFSTNKKSGFTLIEVMVSVSLFVVVAMIATTTFIVFSDANKRSQGLRSSIDNLNFAMESIVLKMREGNNYTCGEVDTPIPSATGCAGYTGQEDGNNAVTFLADNGDIVTYRFAESDDGRTGTIERRVNGDIWESIVAPMVDIESVRFYVDNSGRPKVRVFLSAIVKDKNDTAYGFELQTTISQRL